MTEQSVRGRYFDLLKEHVAGPAEEHLAAIAELGRRLVLADIPPEDIGEMHEEAILRLAREFPHLTLLEAALSTSAAMTEILMAYGLAFRARNAQLQREIAEHKQAEETLRRSEKQASAAIEAARGFTFSYDIATGKVTWGGAIEEITGYTPEEFAQVDIEGWAERIHPEDRDEVLSILQEAIETLDRATAEYRFRKKDGSYVTLASISITERENGKPVRLVGILQDITERKRAEEALRESKALLHVVIDATPALIMVKDRDGKFVLANEETARLYGRTPEEMAGKSLPELVDMSPSDRILFDEYLEGDREVIDSKQPHFIPEEPLTLPGGTTIWVQTTQVPLAIEGNPDCMLSIGADITERKRAEEALQESEERYRILFEQANDGIHLANGNDEIIDVNPRMCEMMGYSRAELLTMRIPDLQAPEVRGQAGSLIKGEVARYGNTVFEALNVRRDGTRIPIEVSVSKVAGLEGELFVSVVRDITERKQAEEEIRQRNRELAALNAITAAMMQSALNLDEVLQRAADGIVEGLGCNTAFIFLLDEEKEVFRGGAVSTKAKILDRMNALIGSPLLRIKIPARRDLNEAVTNLLNGRTTIKHDLYELVKPFWSRRVASTMQRFLNSKTFFTMPLLAKGKTVGGVVASTPEELTERDTEKLMTFANQAAIAIENARLYEETQQRALEQETLREAALALTTALDRNQVIERILAQLQQVVPYDSASVQLLRENQMEIVGGRGFPNLPDLLGTLFPVDGDNPNSEVIRTKAPFIVEDAPAVYEVFRQDPHLQTAIRSWLGVPMLVGERLVGMIALDKSEPAFYTQGHARLAEAFAAQAAVAIENARLFEETEQRVAELEVLRRTSLQLTSSLDLADVLDSISESALSLVGGNDCHIYLYDEMSQTFTFGTALWQNGRQDAAVKTPRSDGFTATVAREGQVMVINDAVQHPLYTSPEARKWGLQAIAGFPLKRAGRVLGVFNIAFLTPHTFSREELRVLGLLADQAAVAIENARLHTETQRRLQEQTMLREAGAVISSTLDLDTVLTRIAEQMCRAVDATSVYICRHERETMTSTVLADYISPQACAREQVSDLGTSYSELDFEFLETMEAGEHDISQLDDPDEPESDRAHMQQYGAQTILYIPLLIRGQLIGFAEAWESRRRREFTTEEITLCQGIAQQAAVAIENARLFTEAEQRSMELSTMLEAARAVSSTLDLEQVLALIVEQMAKAIGVAGCTLSRWDREADAVVVLIEWRQRWTELADEPGTSYALDDYPATRAVLEKHQPITILATDPDAEPTEVAFMQRAGVVSLLMLPLVIGERVIGLVELDETEHEREFTDAEIHLCQALADQVAVAIENARLFEEEKRRSTQLALINEVGDKAASILDSDRLMQEVTRSIQESFNYYNVALLLLDEERRELVLRAIAGGFEHGVEDAYRQSVDEGIVGFVARTGKPWLASDISKDPYYIKGFSEEILTGSELCVPIKLGDKVIGILSMQSVHLNDFAPADVVVMEAVADRVAIAIENARLYEQTQQQSERLAQTLAVSELLHRDLKLEQLLEQIAQGTVELGFRRAVINVYHPEEELVRVRAMAGLEGPDREALVGATYHWSDFQALMQDRFQISRSYLILHEEVDWERDFQGVVVVPRREDRGPGHWHPEDMLLVPLWGSRGEPMGLLSVDEPLDGLLPDLNTIQTLEAFANQAAIAIENARLFEEIEKRRVYLESVLGAAPDAIVTLDAHHRVVEWNSGAERLFGYSREETIGQDLDHLVTKPDVFEEAAGFTRTVMGGGEVPPTETVRYRKDDSPVNVIAAASPIMVEGELIGTVTVYTDITERVRAEREIEERRVYLEGVLGAAPDAIVTLDIHNRVVEWNPGAEKLFGYSREEVIGQNIDNLVTKPDVFEEAIKLTQTVMGGGEVPPTETVRYRKDGSPVDVIVAGSPILVGDKLIGAVVVYTDITERVRMEETLRSLALLDNLTDLFNRRGFFTLAEQHN